MIDPCGPILSGPLFFTVLCCCFYFPILVQILVEEAENDSEVPSKIHKVQNEKIEMASDIS